MVVQIMLIGDPIARHVVGATSEGYQAKARKPASWIAHSYGA
jgi:hypothetical protein